MFHIFIQTHQRKAIPLEVDGSETIDKVKEMIRHELGVMTEAQHLYFPNCRLELEDGRTLDNYNIDNGYTLYLKWHNIGGDFRLTYLYPELGALARKKNLVKMICRKCYGRLPPNATSCRSKKCGGCTDVRRKHMNVYYDKAKKYTWIPAQLAGYKQ